MCGIGGVLHADPSHLVSRETLERMVAALRHRGPDDQGTFLDGSVGLCHTRLSILDLSARGHQPMFSRDGRHVLSYNGEVYNFRELRAELESEGCTFRSTSDTEVVLQLLAAKGGAAVSRLEGMFALALWDRQERSLLLARDRLGIKPLFWARRPIGIAFASEPKALPDGWRTGAPDAASVAEYIAYRHLAGRESLQPDVHTLAPGHWLEATGSQIRIAPYWRPRFERSGDPDDVDEVIRTSVERQLVSDVPVGIFLSGGVDSSLVASAAAASLSSVDSFTVGFEEEGWDESERAQVVADACGTAQHVVRLEPADYPDGLVTSISHLDSPLNHAHSPHLLQLSRFARRVVTVVLTGEGGDELYGGYPRYRLFLASQLIRGVPDPALHALARSLRHRRPRLARVADAAAGDAAHALAINAAFMPLDDAADLAGLGSPEALLAARCSMVEDALAEGAEPANALLALERRTYLVSLLQRMDRLSMAVGLECRVPLLDERVIEQSLSLPPSAKLTLSDSKIPLRRAAERRFGRRYAYAPKSGFGVPLDSWFRSDSRMARLLEGVLRDPRMRRRGLVDADLAIRFLEEHRAATSDRTEALWGLLNLELWARMALDGDSPDAALEDA